jgi:hypothetical protein
MAKYKTNAEAQQDLSRQLQEKARELRPIYDSTDRVLKEKADKLKADIGKIQNQLMMTGSVGALGGGLASGITGLGTGLLDIGAMGANALTGSKLGMASEYLTPGLESVSKEQAGLFGLGKGVGSSIGLSKVLSALNIGANVTDEVMFNGVPVTQILTAVGSLSQAGYKAGKNWQENRGVKKLIEQLGPEGESTLKEFLIRGQDSADPRVAGIVGKLRSDPKYAEIFNVLGTKATEKATAGARVSTKAGYQAEQAGPAIFQAVDNNINGLKEQIKTAGGGAYNKAFEMAGDTPMVSMNVTKDKIATLIDSYKKSDLPDSQNTVKFLEGLQENLTKGEGLVSGVTNVVQTNKMTIPQLQSWLTDFGKKAAGGESLITDVSIGTQQKIASAIFGGLKDDLKGLAQSTNVDERGIANLMMGASKQTRQAVEKYQGAIAQGLPEILKNKNIASIDTDTLMNTISGLSAGQQKNLFGILKNTAPEDLKRIQQVNYDNFVQGARTKLPDGTDGVDLKLLAGKFNTLPETEKSKLALSLGTSLDDFSGRMKDAESFFKYQQAYAGKVADAKVNPAELSQAAYALTGGSYTGGKIGAMAGNIWNSIKGGLSDENTLNFLISPETKGILRDSIVSPNSQKTIDKLSRVLGQADVATPVANAAQQGYRGAVSAVQRPDVAAPQAPTEPWDIGPATETTPTTTQTAPTGSTEPWDLGPASSVAPAEIEAQIRAEAQKQGLGQYADMFVKQAKQESGYNPYAVSKAGAQGVFQLMPGTAKDLGVTDPFDVAQNISGGINYMGQQLNRFKDPALALAAYNAGPKRVADFGGIPNIPETQDYVKRILGG